MSAFFVRGLPLLFIAASVAFGDAVAADFSFNTPPVIGRGFGTHIVSADGKFFFFLNQGQFHSLFTGNCAALPGDCTGTGTINQVNASVTLRNVGAIGSAPQSTSSGTLTIGSQSNAFSGLVIANLSQRPFAAIGIEPVNLLTGELFDQPKPDLRLRGPIDVTFERRTGSLLAYNGLNSALGTNWQHNYDIHVYATSTQATIALFSGETLSFLASGSTWVPALPYRLNFQLQSVAGGGYKFVDPSTNFVYTFNASGSLTRIEDRNGNAITVTQGPNGPTQVSDGLGRTLTFTYSTAGRLTKVADSSRSVSFTYNGTVLTSFTDAAGKVTSYTTTSIGSTASPTGVIGAIAGLITKVTSPGGNTQVSQTYDGVARVTAQTDGRGNNTTVAYTLSQPGNATVTDALGNATTYSHANLRDFNRSVDANGQVTSTAFDSSGRPISVIDRNGNTSLATYHDPSGYIASLTDAAGNKTSLGYSASPAGGFNFFDQTSTTFPDGSTESLAYDTNGNVTKFTDRAGKATTLTYNSRGQVLTETNPLGGVTTRTYNSDGTLASVKTHAGDTTTFVYDSLKRLTQVKNPDNTSSSFAYDALDRLTQSTDERGKVTKATYTDNGKLQTLTDPLGNVTTLAYDAAENLTSIKRPTGTTTIAYNAANLPDSLTTPTSEVFKFAYDKLNRLASVTDAVAKILAYTRDKEGAVTSVTDGANRTFQITPDALGRPTQLTTPLGAVYKQTFDKLGRIVSTTDPLGAVTSYSFDPRGLLTGVVAPGDIRSSYGYDAAGNLTSATDANGSTWTIAYDAQSRPISRKDPAGRTVSYTYDARGRLATATNGTGSVTFTYDAAGNLVRKLYSDGTDQKYTYDDANRLTGGNGLSLAYNADGQIVNSNGFAIERDGSRRVASIMYPPGKVTYSYDNRGLISKLVDWRGQTSTFTHDASGRLSTITRPNRVVSQYTYDGDGYLSRVTETFAPAASGAAARTEDPLMLSDNRVERGLGGGILNSTSMPFTSNPLIPGLYVATFAADGAPADATTDASGRPTRFASGEGFSFFGDSPVRTYRGAGDTNLTFDAFAHITGLLSSGAFNQKNVWLYLDPDNALPGTSETNGESTVIVPVNFQPFFVANPTRGQTTFLHGNVFGDPTLETNGAGDSQAFFFDPEGNGTADGRRVTDSHFLHGREASDVRGTPLVNVGGRFLHTPSGRFLDSREPAAAEVFPFNLHDFQSPATVGHISSFVHESVFEFPDPCPQEPTSFHRYLGLQHEIRKAFGGHFSDGPTRLPDFTNQPRGESRIRRVAVATGIINTVVDSPPEAPPLSSGGVLLSQTAAAFTPDIGPFSLNGPAESRPSFLIGANRAVRAPAPVSFHRKFFLDFQRATQQPIVDDPAYFAEPPFQRVRP